MQISEVERRLGVPPPPMAHMNPSDTLWEASQTLITSHARRLPLLDVDTATEHQLIVSVLTQYRLLEIHFHQRELPSAPLLGRVAANPCLQCKETESLHLPFATAWDRNICGSFCIRAALCFRFEPIKTATLDTPVFDVVNMFFPEVNLRRSYIGSRGGGCKTCTKQWMSL